MRKGRQIMAIDKVREYLKQWSADGRIREFQVSSATVELAAQALNLSLIHILCAEAAITRTADGRNSRSCKENQCRLR